jgi:hypothetical protein
MQALDNVDGILTAQGSVDGVRSDQSVKKRSRKRCKISKWRCSIRFNKNMRPLGSVIERSLPN